MLLRPPAGELRRRLPRLVMGLALMGLAIGLTVRADLGLAPWDVLHQGLAGVLGVPMGWVTIAVGLAVLLAWIPLRERLGIGTVLNTLLVGLCIDLSLVLLPHTDVALVRWAELGAALLLFGVGSGLYIGSGLGPGPRDGLMTALVRRGRAVWTVRTAIEVSALALGVALGGTVGVGTVVMAFAIGPVVHVSLGRLALPPLAPTPAHAPAPAGS